MKKKDNLKYDLDEDTVPEINNAIIPSSILESLIDPIFILKKLRGNWSKNRCLNVKWFRKMMGIYVYDLIHFLNKPTLSHATLFSSFIAIEG